MYSSTPLPFSGLVVGCWAGLLLVALDDLSTDKASILARSLCGLASGFKVGLPFLLRNGVSSLKSLRAGCSDALWVADLKLADIGYVMKLTASMVLDSVDAMIAHGFVGVRGALDELKEYLDSLGKKLVVVVSMSHPGAEEVYDKALSSILSVAAKLKPWGVVAPATRPSIIRVTRETLGQGVKILSPGVGAQGARPGEALCAGADYEIVGRLITGAEDPIASAEKVVSEQEEMLRRCRG